MPEWIHILPAGDIATVDNRGPYRAANLPAIIAASFQLRDRIPVDENHSLHLAAPKGQPSPARGWIVAMQLREDGIWAQVEWSKTGRAMMAERQYRAVSPVITHTDAKEIIAIEAVSLVNRPNLRGLTALNMEQSEMTFMERLIKALGLSADATEEDVLKALPAEVPAEETAALQSVMAEIGTALGVQGAAPEQLTQAVTALNSAVTELEGKNVALQSELDGLKTNASRAKAEAFVDDAIRAKRAGVKPKRDIYISMHMQNPAQTEEIVNAMPVLGATPTTDTPPAERQHTALNAEQMAVCKALNIAPDAYAQTLADEKEAI